jgi:hypothetical protein
MLDASTDDVETGFVMCILQNHTIVKTAKSRAICWITMNLQCVASQLGAVTHKRLHQNLLAIALMFSYKFIAMVDQCSSSTNFR